MEIIGINPDNLENYGVGCLKNPNYPGFVKKPAWLLRALVVYWPREVESRQIFDYL